MIEFIKIDKEKNTEKGAIKSHNEDIKEDAVLNNFEVYMLHGHKIFKMIKLDKNIDNKNIIEKLINKLFDLNILIL